jgi:predicted nucleic acid-binding protein
MKPSVVDASVIAAAFFPEKYSDVARSLLLSGVVLLAPDLIYAEMTNVVWKRFHRGEILEEEASALMHDVLELPLEITPSKQLAALALELAKQSGRTAYDCLYVALAALRETKMITADRRLANALATGPLRDHVAWIGAKL